MRSGSFPLALALVVGLAVPVLADKPAPAPPPSKAVRAPFEIRYEKGAKHHKLIVPKKLLADVKLSQIEESLGPAEVTLGGSGRTILAGCALSLAIGSLVVLRKRQAVAAAVMVAGAVALGAGSYGWADVPLDPPQKESIELQVVEKGETVVLVVPNGT